MGNLGFGKGRRVVKREPEAIPTIMPAVEPVKPITIEKLVEVVKIVEVPVETIKIVEIIKEVIVEKPVEVVKEVEKIVEKIVLNNVEVPTEIHHLVYKDKTPLWAWILIGIEAVAIVGLLTNYL